MSPPLIKVLKRQCSWPGLGEYLGVAREGGTSQPNWPGGQCLNYLRDLDIVTLTYYYEWAEYISVAVALVWLGVVFVVKDEIFIGYKHVYVSSAV